VARTFKQVFISSTVFDLPEHRKEANEACWQAGMAPIDMKDWAASDADAAEVCKRKVADADVYLGIFAHRYGYCPPDSDISITEMEYEWAGQFGIERLVFVMDKSHPILIDDVEFGEGKKRLDRFKARLDTGHTCPRFRSPDDLGKKVLQALFELQRPGPRSVAEEEPLPAAPESTPVRPVEQTEPRPAPPIAPPAAPRDAALPAERGLDVGAALIVTYSPNGRRWQAVPVGGGVPRESRIRIVFQPDTACHVLLLIETLNREGTPFQLDCLSPEPSLEGSAVTAVRPSGEWQSIPRGAFLQEQVPDLVSAWRIGLLVQREPPTEVMTLLQERTVEEMPAADEARGAPTAAFQHWFDNVKGRLPDSETVRSERFKETVFGLGIDDEVETVRLRGRGSFVHWTDVPFS
jgi:hypothetical protein